MNNTFKSRVWDKNENRFRYGNEFTVNGNGDIFCNDYSGMCQNERFIFQHYTGLKDRNQKEIYEGDILKHPQATEPEENGFIVVWNNFGWVCVNVNYRFDPYYNATFDGYFSQTEVIGNIHENPELLKS